MMEKYELDEGRYHENEGHITRIAILTGCEYEDIKLVAPDKKLWKGTDYVKTFNKLGFNTNPRFVSFDKDTYYPCLMRYHNKDELKYWYAFAYYDGIVYQGCSMKCTLDEWLEAYGHRVVITSMLQVWI